MYDLIIIGAGAAGLSAGIYAGRRQMKTLIISKDLGGQAAKAGIIENYPGIESIDGFDLMDKFRTQAEKFGAEILYEEVAKISEIQDNEFNFNIKLASGQERKSKAVMLCFGLTPRDLGIPGEQEFKTKGVTYCATCDAPLYKGKDVAVVGGGNSALDAAEILAKIANKVYLVHRREEFRAEKILVDRAKQANNLEFLLNSEIKEIMGDKVVKNIIVADNNENKKELAVDGVFIEIGFIAKVDMIKDLVKLNERNEIITTKDCETNVPGLFAAGDITDISYKQVVISAGEGVKAALQAYKFIQHNGQTVGMDWGKK